MPVKGKILLHVKGIEVTGNEGGGKASVIEGGVSSVLEWLISTAGY